MPYNTCNSRSVSQIESRCAEPARHTQPNPRLLETKRGNISSETQISKHYYLHHQSTPTPLIPQPRKHMAVQTFSQVREVELGDVTPGRGSQRENRNTVTKEPLHSHSPKVVSYGSSYYESEGLKKEVIIEDVFLLLLARHGFVCVEKGKRDLTCLGKLRQQGFAVSVCVFIQTRARFHSMGVAHCGRDQTRVFSTITDSCSFADQ